ncbi:MAG: hypothetical protein DRP56_09125, partial [Planctomycetota bacterium]
MDTKTKDIQSTCIGFINAVETADIGTSDGVNTKQNAIEWNRGFYNGAHWTRNEYNAYALKGIEPVTVNRCRAIVKAICGMQNQNAQMIAVEPRKGGTQSVADVLTELTKHAQDMSTPDAEGSDYIYSENFQTGLIDRMSFLKAAKDHVGTPGGQLRFKSLSSYNVDVDPLAKEYNLNESARFVIERMWRDKDEMDILYGDKIQQENPTGDASDDIYSYFTDDYSAEMDETTKKYRYRVREIWWKEKIEGLLVVDRRKNIHRVTTDKKEMQKLRAGSKKGLRYHTETVAVDVMHKTLMLGKVVLEDTENPHDDVEGFPYFRFCPYWHEGDFAGILDDIIELNREENQSRTQIKKNLTQTLNTGWKVKGGTKKKKQELADFGSVDGLVLDESEYGNGAEKIEGNSVPIGHFAQAEQMERDIKLVS